MDQSIKKNKNLKSGFIRPGVKEILHKINRYITSKEVRVVGENIQEVYILLKML
jgi:hypothetical protein